MRYLSIDKCHAHGFFAISINDKDKGIGERLTSSKCCGRWETIKEWRMDSQHLLKISVILKAEAEEMAREETGSAERT